VSTGLLLPLLILLFFTCLFFTCLFFTCLFFTRLFFMPTPPETHKTEEDWKNELTQEQYYVCRQHGTERPFANAYWDNHARGRYNCVACGNPLFSSETKFESGSGWPSFFAAVGPESIASTIDKSHGMVREEIHCATCNSHLGHVFPDGPRPTGLRYCMNSAAMRFEAVTE